MIPRMVLNHSTGSRKQASPASTSRSSSAMPASSPLICCICSWSRKRWWRLTGSRLREPARPRGRPRRRCQAPAAALILSRKTNCAKIKLTLRELCHRRRLLSKRLPQTVNTHLMYRFHRNCSYIKRDENRRDGAETGPCSYPVVRLRDSGRACSSHPCRVRCAGDAGCRQSRCDRFRSYPV
jgi:hypothetical protein